MACCGGGRAQPRTSRTTPLSTNSEPHTHTRGGGAAPRSEQGFMQYQGRSALRAVGGGTGRTYRFDRPGAVVGVDPRDLRSLLRVPGLRQVPAGTAGF